MAIFVKDFASFKETVPAVLKEAGLAEKIKNEKIIVLKPNLTTNRPPPCTTPAKLIEEVIKFCRAQTKGEMIVAEGSGGCNTQQAFADLGYYLLRKKYSVKLIDLNRSERILLKNHRALVLKEVNLPKIVLESFFINLPVLKEHNEAILTCAAKNLFGLYLNEKEESLVGWWNKSELHSFGVHQAICDLNLYRPSDFVLVDASVGQKGSEIYGSPAQPPIRKLVAGFDALEVDRFCAPLLGLDPKTIPFLILG